MESSSYSFPRTASVALCEYELVIYPDARAMELIGEEWNNLAQEKGLPPLMESPLIVLARFKAKEAMEETLSRWIQNACNLQVSFTVSLNNYGAYPPHTIYLRIQDAQPIHRLTGALKMLDGFIQSNDCPPLHLNARPCLPLVTPVAATQFESLSREFAQRCFHHSFQVDRLVLHRKNKDRSHDIINTFALPATLNAA